MSKNMTKYIGHMPDYIGIYLNPRKIYRNIAEIYPVLVTLLGTIRFSIHLTTHADIEKAVSLKPKVQIICLSVSLTPIVTSLPWVPN